MAFKIRFHGEALKIRSIARRQPATAGLGRLRKIACLGGALTSLKHAPWHDPTWELWAHHSCRNQCEREPDLYFDLHPPALWKDPKKKYWDKTYLKWLSANRTPMYMQEAYPEAPAALKYPFGTIITEFPRGYFTNTLSYMIALALTEGVTHLGIFGCNYDAQSEYGPQRGCAEYWLGLAEGRGVTVLIPPGCDLLGRPALLYGYESHPNGVRDKSYSFHIGVPVVHKTDNPKQRSTGPNLLYPADGPDAPPLRDIGVPPALHRRDVVPTSPPQGNGKS